MAARKFRRRTMSTKELPPEQGKRVLAAMHALLAQENGNRAGLARRLRLSAPSVSNLFNGKNAPSFDTAVRVASAQGISVTTLLGERVPDVRLPDLTSHPNLLTALEMAGERATEAARRNTLAAAAYLPDLATPTWLGVLLDPAHGKSG
jgi:transcriptional regulator with XRE-family HTH domain